MTIGDHFHSGRDCLIISPNHNYDAGNAIPYDDTFVYKDVMIEDNVWIGDRVIILGGNYRRRSCGTGWKCGYQRYSAFGGCRRGTCQSI